MSKIIVTCLFLSTVMAVGYYLNHQKEKNTWCRIEIGPFVSQEEAQQTGLYLIRQFHSQHRGVNISNAQEPILTFVFFGPKGEISGDCRRAEGLASALRQSPSNYEPDFSSGFTRRQ